VDFGPEGCPTGQVDGFTNLAAPEVRAFVEGNETPPVAARPLSPPVIKSVGAAPVDFSPLTCESGSWSGSPTINYTFQLENGSSQALQSGPSDVFTPPPSLVGVSTDRSVTTPAIAADAAPPVVSITTLKCHVQACVLSLTASDPNGVMVAVTASAAYRITVKCPVRKGHRKKGKQPVCHRTRTVGLPVNPVSAGLFSAVASGLPYGERISFAVSVVDAAGLRPATAPLGSTVLRKPKPKHKKKPKPRKGKR
jgi:hypothetical protein